MKQNGPIEGVYPSKSRLYVRVSKNGIRRQAPFTNEWLEKKGLKGSANPHTRAERIRQKLLELIEAEQGAPAAASKACTVSEAMHRFLDARANQPSTERPSPKQLKRLRSTLLSGTKYRPSLRDHLGERKRIAMIQPEDISAFQTKLEDRGASPNSIRAWLSDCRTFFSWCEAMGLIAQSPFRSGRFKMPPSRGISKDKAHLNQMELSRIENALRGCENLQRVWMLARYTGARRCELLQIRFSDIDLRRNQITIRGAKKNRAKEERLRYVPLVPELREFILSLNGGSNWYVASLSESLWSDGAFKCAARRFTRKSGVSIELQRMRRTFAQILADAGMPLEQVADALGNSVATLKKWYIQPARQQWDRGTFAAIARGAVSGAIDHYSDRSERVAAL